MKIVVFAGGVGSRLWPISRKNAPKQFEKLLGDKSTLQQAVERLMPTFKPTDIYMATGQKYYHTIREQLPQIPEENFILEPAMRDVGPAIGLMAAVLSKKFADEPIAILWSDHLVQNEDVFRDVLKSAEKKVRKGDAEFVFIAQKPRFPNQNCGWIEVGSLIESAPHARTYEFKQLRYRPTLAEAADFYSKENFVWNLGYFVTTPHYLLNLFAEFLPDMHGKLLEFREKWQTDEFKQVIEEAYPKLEKISFDDAILVKLNKGKVFVMSADLGWSDIGTWDALKEALAKTSDENVVKGNVQLENTQDSLVFNYSHQLVVGIDLSEMIVINTDDVVLICPKKSVPKIKKIVENLTGTSHEHLA